MRLITHLLMLFMTLCLFSQRKNKERIIVPKTQEDSIRFEAALIEAEKQLILEKYTKALEHFITALEMNNQSAVVNFKIAEIMFKKNEEQKAVPYNLRAVELAPNNKYYQLSLARLYQSIGFFKDAVRTYENLLLKYPSNESALYELAELYQNLGRIEDMFNTFDKIENQLGIKVEIVRERQRILMKKNDWDGVITEYRKLIDAYPHEISYKIELIEFLIRHRRIEEAKREIALYEASELSLSPVIIMKSKLAWLQGERTRALDLLEKSFELNTLNFDTKFQMLSNYSSLTTSAADRKRIITISLALAEKYEDKYEIQTFVGDILHQYGEKEKSLTYYLRAVNISPSIYAVWQNIVNIESELNQYDSVIVHAEQALEYFPNQASFYYYVGTGYLINNEYEKSINALEQGKKYTIDPDLLTIFYGQLGDAYNGMKNYEKSDASYEEALKNKPSNDHVLNNYSYFLSLRKKNVDKALKMSTKLIAQHPDNPTYLDTHGWVLYVNGKYKEAKKYLEKAANLDGNATIVEHYGDVLFQLGDVEGAIAQWERARKHGKASKNIDRKIADRKIYE